jgi:hypothetical protein
MVEHVATQARNWWRVASRADEIPLLVWLTPVIWGALAVCAKLLATPWLVKKIPGVEEDDRHPVALWLTLLGWLALAMHPLN